MDHFPSESTDTTLDAVREYYGETLSSSSDLKTSACCSTDALPDRHRTILADVEDEVMERFYGCGSPVPPVLDGCTVLDLGCGTGRDAFLASKLAGPEGQVIGVDMTEEQLAVAKNHEQRQAERFGFDAPNTSFRYGFIEDLKEIGIEDNSVDVVISNCVINLSIDKRAVFEEIFRVLKEGGELYFSDIFADRRIPPERAADPTLRGECLGGALYTGDFRRLLRKVGCPDYRVLSSRPVEVDHDEIARKLGNINFTSKTVRAFNLETLEDRCEDYGQVAYYRGGVEEMPNAFVLDDHHRFEKDRPLLVCGNTAAMLEETRFAAHFDVVGDRSTHYGLFDCEDDPVAEADGDAGGCC